MKTGRLARLTQLGKLAAGVAGSAISNGFEGLSMGKDRAMHGIHAEVASRLFETLSQLKGLPMKVGQILSYMDGVIPLEYQHVYRDALSKLQTTSEPLPWDEIRPHLERELGTSLEEVFQKFDPKPLAAASIGQVYKAVMLDGRKVAVKIQYPGIAEALHSDITVIRTLFGTLRRVVPALNVEQMMQDMLMRFEEECDYKREAKLQKEFARLWAHDERVIIPEVIEELSSPRIFVSTFYEGETLSELVNSADKKRKSEVGEVLFWFALRSILHHGLFNADPHPGNYLFPGGDKVVFLDFGCVQRYDKSTSAEFRLLRDALLSGKRKEELWSVLASTLAISPDAPPTVQKLFEEYLLFCFEPALAPQPFRFTSAYTSRLSELTLQAKLTVFKNLFKGGWPEPKREGVVFFSRILFGLNSILASLEAEGDWRDLLAKA